MPDLIEFIHSRHSEAKLVAPAPEGATLESILSCALRAPDHGALRPWRYIVIEGEARQRLGEVWEQALRADMPDAPDKVFDKARNALLRAPMVIVAVTRVQAHQKVPAIEQHLSTGVGLGYLLLALQSRGFGGFWRTGDMAYDARIRRCLGLDSEEAITGFLYVGTPKSSKTPLPMPPLNDHLSFWNPND